MMTLFPLGRTVATPAALAEMASAGESPGRLLARHQSGDWGAVPKEDARANEQALRTGTRLLSAYPLSTRGEGLDHHRGRPLLYVPLAPRGVLRWSARAAG